MRIALPPIPDAERTPLVVALLAIIDQQQQRLQTLAETVLQLRDEIAILKGEKPRPTIAPSILEKPAKLPAEPGQQRPGSAKLSKKTATLQPLEVTIPFPDPPPGSVSNGYEEYDVQELVLQAKLTRYRRERVVTAAGHTLLAPLPVDILPGSHFGAALIAFMLYQYHPCNVTQPLLLEQLRELGIAISAGQINNFLTANLDGFHQEKAAILTAGLAVSSYIGVDDTGARHEGHNGYCTALGNDLFAYFESTDSKSRLNFLTVLRGASDGYALNEITLAYWARQKLAQDVVASLSAGARLFTCTAVWEAWLAAAGVTTARHILIATEGALLGQLIEQGVSPHLLILSDGAPQFDILVHASCWVHAQRPLARAIPYTEAHRTALEQVRQQLWDLYQDLKAYRAQPDPRDQAGLEARFDLLVGQKTDYPTTIGAALKEMRGHKADLLRVLERPEVPLHNNGTESIIRGYVKTRKISGSTRSDAGRRCRDTFASLKKTCRKLGESFWEYLKDRLGNLGKFPRLADLIRQRAAEGQDAGIAEAVPA